MQYNNLYPQHITPISVAAVAKFFSAQWKMLTFKMYIIIIIKLIYDAHCAWYYITYQLF